MIIQALVFTGASFIYLNERCNFPEQVYATIVNKRESLALNIPAKSIEISQIHPHMKALVLCYSSGRVNQAHNNEWCR